MGTRVEYGINVLAASTKGSRFSLDESESQRLNPSFEITGFDQHRNSNKMAADNKHGVDFIRNTMQLHDRIFKQQVKELHRLYSVQKMLMEEMKKNNKRPEKRLREDEETTPTERSGSCSNEIQTIKLIKTPNTAATGRGFDLEKTTDQEDVSTGVISRTEGNVEDEEEAEIELTLSIGRRSTKKLKTEKLIQQQQEDSSTPTSTSSKKPHWLFHGLPLNRTSSSSIG